MKKVQVLLFLLVFPILLFGQHGFQDPLLSIKSKDSVNGQPQLSGSLGTHMKLNGYYDVFGGLQNNDTFNVGFIDVFGTDDTKSFNMDMYQTQIKLQGAWIKEDGEKISAVIEFDFWGGNGNLRLRKAYIESGHWEIGQNWTNFGDATLWPNTMEWEGPPSGIWVRSPHVKYFNTFKNKSWIYEISLEAPITNYIAFPELEFDIEETNQTAPDLTFAVKKKYDWGHLRVSSILRNVSYKKNDNVDNFLGYGLNITGYHKTAKKNNFQFMMIAGKGITAYMTGLAGLGYDGFPKNDNSFESTPAFGGWASYEYFLTKKIHTNLVFGYTNYDFNDLEEFTVNIDEDDKILVVQGDFNNIYYYGIVNLMYDPHHRMTFGIEVNYGVKKIEFDGFVNNNFINQSKSRDALRISFGFMFDL